MNVLTEYPDIIKEILIPMIIALFAISLPLLLQTISRIDDKYSSTKLTEVFYKDWKSITLIILQILALISVIAWIYRQPRNVDWGFLNIWIDYSALLFIGLSTLLLVVWLFVFVYLIKLFYNPSQLLEYLIKKHNRANSASKIQYFLAISDILYFSIQKANEKLARRLIEFFYNIFGAARQNKEGSIIIYPPEYYDTLFEANELLCLRKKKTISYYNNSALLDLLIDSYQKTKISEETYTAIWVCLRQALEYQREDIVMSYWGNAHQHFDLFMQQTNEERNEKFEITNTEEISKRDFERKRFLEFHYALGGLLFYQKKWILLKRIMSFTNQTPPKYVLVPETMIEAINIFMSVKEPLHNPFYYESHYSFPDISGINKGDIIIMWIRKYCAVLFLRQYTLHDYYYGRTVLELPNVPSTLKEMREWKEELEELKIFVEELITDKIPLNEIGLGHLTNEWFIINEKQRPSDLIDTLINKTNVKYEETKITQPVSESKKEDFKNQTKEIILKTINLYSDIENINEIEDDSKSFFINGVYQLMEKAGFAENQDISYMNSNSIVAQSVASKIHFKLTSTFSFFIDKKFILKPEDIFLAIDRLGLNLADYFLISFGLHLPYYKEILKVANLNKVQNVYYYNSLKIISLDTYVHDTVRNSIILINKNDLPKLKFNTIKAEEFKRYELEELDKRTHLAASIIDLNTRKDLRDEISQKSKDDITKNVLACISLDLEIVWKKSSKCFQIKPFDQFLDRGNPVDLIDIEPLK
jgi:hypothetical protein